MLNDEIFILRFENFLWKYSFANKRMRLIDPNFTSFLIQKVTEENWKIFHWRDTFSFQFSFLSFFFEIIHSEFSSRENSSFMWWKKSKYKKNHDRSWVFFRAGWEINSFERGILSFFSSSYSCILNNIVMWSVVIVSL
jgi:hypothetical protein